jgi:hypothetical protein
MAELGTNVVTNGGVTMPQWYQDLSGNLANSINSAATTAGGLSSNWYNQPVAAPITGLQNQAATGAATPFDPNPGMQSAQGSLNQFQTQFDPSKLASFMSPYTGQAMDTVARLGNQNLQENTLPGVNSTFTGAGQFGSTRNAEFNNRAIRDEGRNVLETQGNLLNGQYNNAMTQMQEWNKNPLLATQAQSGLTTANQTANWNTLDKQYNMGKTLQGDTQNILNQNYQDWLNSNLVPQNMLGGLSAMLPNISQIYSKAPVSNSSAVLPLSSVGGAGGLGAIANAAGTLLS